MNVWGITDRGKIREQNQDAFAHQVLPDGRVIALVCDGMGGARAGNIASSMAVDVFMEAFLEDGEDSQETEEDSRSETDLKRSAELSRELDEDYFQWKEQQEGSGEEPDHRGRGKGFSLFGQKW